MAISPAAVYPGQIDITDPTGYPYGRAKNVAAIGDGTGTPLERSWVGDLFGFEQALLGYAGLTPNGLPEKVGGSQYLDALIAAADKRSRLGSFKSQALNWPERSSFSDIDSPGANGVMGLAWAPTLGYGGGGLWVAQTNGLKIWTSDDGMFWADRGLVSSASFTNPCIAYGQINGAAGFLLCQNGNPAFYYTSIDGITWSGISTTAVPANPVAAYSTSLGLWVMAGNAGVIYTSPTALANTWTARTTPAGWIAGCGGTKRIVWNGSLFVILPLASYNKCLTSNDGVTWTERTLPSSLLWTGLAWSDYDQLWIASSNSMTIAASLDGITWAGFNTAAAANDLAVNGPVWVMTLAAGALGGVAWSIDRGASWLVLSVGNHRVATAGWNRIVAGDKRFMVSHMASLSGSNVEFALSQRAV